MAARTIRPKHTEEIRAKIQATQLINRLQNHALNLGDDELSPSKVKAIEILLRKSVPDLSNVQISGDSANPLLVGINVKFD